MRLPVSLLDALDVGKLLANYEYTKRTVEEFREMRESIREKWRKWFASLSPEQLDIYYAKRRERQTRFLASLSPEQLVLFRLSRCKSVLQSKAKKIDKYRKIDCEYFARKMQRMTSEEREDYRAYRRERDRLKKQRMTPEQREHRRQQQRQSYLRKKAEREVLKNSGEKSLDN